MQMKIVDRSFYIRFVFDISVPIVCLVFFTYLTLKSSFDSGLTKDIVLMFILSMSVPLLEFCLIGTQWIYLFNKFKNSSIVIGRRGKEIIFLDKDYRFVLKKSEIKKIEIYSEIMHITQLGYSYRLTIEGKDKKLTLYDHSKALLLYLESPNTEIIEKEVNFSAFKAR